MKLTEIKERTMDYMKGDFTLTKLDFFLIAAVMLLMGICIGLLTAPFTHGVRIGCNNGNNIGNAYGDDDADCAEAEEAEC